MARPRLYLSASIANAPVNARLRDALAPSYELFLPQELTHDVEHTKLPRAIFEACIDEMERCDAAIVLLDALGIDCAMECGWLLGRKKKVVAIAGSSVQFARLDGEGHTHRDRHARSAGGRHVQGRPDPRLGARSRRLGVARSCGGAGPCA